MLEGNRFFPETGIPIRKIACISNPFALADPVPLTLASLSAKSFVLITCRWCTFSLSPFCLLCLLSGGGDAGRVSGPVGERRGGDDSRSVRALPGFGERELEARH